jgi:hypothetical protein
MQAGGQAKRENREGQTGFPAMARCDVELSRHISSSSYGDSSDPSVVNVNNNVL